MKKLVLIAALLASTSMAYADDPVPKVCVAIEIDPVTQTWRLVDPGALNLPFPTYLTPMKLGVLKGFEKLQTMTSPTSRKLQINPKYVIRTETSAYLQVWSLASCN